MFYTNLTHARVINERWSYKLNVGFYGSGPFARPVGNIDNSFHTPYPAFTNTGTEQPKFDGRVDYDFADGISKLVISGGYAGTSGIIHTGIGPFQIEFIHVTHSILSAVALAITTPLREAFSSLLFNHSYSPFPEFSFFGIFNGTWGVFFIFAAVGFIMASWQIDAPRPWAGVITQAAFSGITAVTSAPAAVSAGANFFRPWRDPMASPSTRTATPRRAARSSAAASSTPTTTMGWTSHSAGN